MRIYKEHSLYQNRNQTETKYTVLRMGCKTEICCLAGCWSVAVVVWMSVPTFVMNTLTTIMETKTYRASGFYWRQTLTINRPEAKILQLWSRIHQRMTFLVVLYSQWNRLLGVEEKGKSVSFQRCLPHSGETNQPWEIYSRRRRHVVLCHPSLNYIWWTTSVDFTSLHLVDYIGGIYFP